MKGARQNNLRTSPCELPLGTMTCVTGVSGSGKSSLVIDTLLHARWRSGSTASKEKPGEHDEIVGWQLLDKVIDIDQAPIGRTPRSNPATYTGLFTHIRELFAQLPDARVRGYEPGRFSFNVKGGRCEACAGDGVLRIEMHFLPDVYVTCEVCHGTRYNRETLEVRYKGKSIADVLDLSVGQALEFLGTVPPIRHKLETLRQRRPRLHPPRPGGHHALRRRGAAHQARQGAQPARRPAARSTSSTSPPPACTSTTSTDCSTCSIASPTPATRCSSSSTTSTSIKTADWVIDLGPEGGAGGGAIVAIGTPEEVAATPGSYTGKYLRPLLRGLAA